MIPRIGLVDVLGCLLLIVAVIVSPSPAGDPGIGWHLKSGELMLERGGPLYEDPFLATATPRAWVHNQWLSDIVLAAIYDIGSWPLLHAFAIATVLVLAFGVLAPFIRARGVAPIICFFVLALTVFQITVQWFLRPVLFSFFFFALQYCLLCGAYEDVRAGKRLAARTAIYVLLTTLIWANLHPAFVLGLLMIAALIVSLVFERVALKTVAPFVLLFLLAVLVPLCTPYGFSLYQNIAGLAGSEFFMNLNAEWLSVNFHHPLFVPFGFTLLLLVLALARDESQTLTAFDVFLVLGFLALALMQRRYVPFFALASCYPLGKLLSAWLGDAHDKGLVGMLKNIDRDQQRGTSGVYAVGLTVLLVAYTAFSGPLPARSEASSGLWPHYPHKAVAFLAESGKTGKLYHSPNWGGFITWTGYPQQRAYLDDRNQLNGEERYRRVIRVQGGLPGWESILKEEEIELLLLERAAAVRAQLESSKSWTLLYEDQHAVVYERLL